MIIADLAKVIVNAVVSVFTTVGIIQYLKQLFPKFPDLVWKIGLPVLGTLSFVAISLLPDAVLLWALGIALVIAGGQLFYDVVIKLFTKFIEWLKSIIKK